MQNEKETYGEREDGGGKTEDRKSIIPESENIWPLSESACKFIMKQLKD